MNTAILNEYRRARRNHATPMTAINLARKRVSEGKQSHCGYTSFLPGSTITRQHNRPEYAYMESIDWRVVGFADEIAKRRINHKGWFIDEFQDEVYRGIVYRLPRNRGFIAGYADPNNNGAAFIELSPIDDEIQAAYAADRIAEHEAETERNYREAWQASRRYEDIDTEISDIRSNILALLVDTHDLRRAAFPYVRPSQPIYIDWCASVRRKLNNIRKLRKERAELLVNYGNSKGWEE